MLLTPLILGTFVFLLYLSGVSPGVYGGDSGDLIVSAWFSGIAHAPGYPLNSIFGWFFTHLPYHATVAFKANLTAAFYQASVIAFFYLCIRNLTKNTLVALATALTLAFTTLFWLYAHIIEVFQLNVLLVVVSFYFLLLWRETQLARKPKMLWFYLCAFFAGFAVFHHQTSVLVMPAFIYLILKTKKDFISQKKVIFLSLGAFSLGFIPYLYFPVVSILDKSPTNWDDAKSVVNLIRIITRSDYGTFVAASPLVGSSFTSRLAEIANYILFVRADFTIIGVLLMICGTVFLFKFDKAIFWFLTLAVIISGPFFLFYAGFPIVNDFYSGLWERFLLLSYLFLAFFLAFGYLAFISAVQWVVSKSAIFEKNNKYLFIMLLSLLIFFLPVRLYSSNRFKTDMSSFHLGDWLGNDILASTEENGIIFLLGDTQTFNTEYIYYTNNIYNSRKIVRAGSLGDVDYREKFTRTYKEFEYPEDFLDKNNTNSEYYIKSLIDKNKDNFPIYFYANPITIDNYRWISSGLLKRLISNDKYSKDDLVKLNRDLNSKFMYKDFGAEFTYSQFMTTHLRESYYIAMEHTALELIDNNLNEEASYYLNQALLLFPDGKDIYAILGNEYLLKNDCEMAKKNYEKVLELDKNEWRAFEAIGKVYEDCYDDKKTAEIYMQKAINLRKDLLDEKLN